MESFFSYLRFSVEFTLMNAISSAQHIIGRKDIIDFPSFDLQNVRVKIDSGAYSSSMHCSSIQLLEDESQTVLEVVFLEPGVIGYTGEKHYFNKFDRKTVKSSNGYAQERFFIKGTVLLFSETIETTFSLTERTGLKHPVLLGRRLLNKRFLIDTAKVNCSFKASK